MFLSRLELDTRSREVRRDLADCHEMHRTLLRAFPDVDTTSAGARSACGVLFRLESQLRPPVIYVQSQLRPTWDELPPGYLSAITTRAGGNPGVREIDHEYSVLEAGQRLRFRLFANPTRKIDTATGPDGKRRNGRRVPLTSDEARLTWLQRKASEGGFRLVQSRVAPAVPDVRESQQQQRRGRKGRGTRSARLTFDGVLFEGILEVEEAERFRQTLSSGIGPGKAYGFGMLSLARA